MTSLLAGTLAHGVPTLPYPTLPNPTLPYPTLPYPTLPYPTLPYPTLPYLSCKEQRMISEIYILFFKASLTIRHTATVSQKKSRTSKKIQWDFQISRVGSLDFLDLKVNGSPGKLGLTSGLPGAVYDVRLKYKRFAC